MAGYYYFVARSKADSNNEKCVVNAEHYLLKTFSKALYGYLQVTYFYNDFFLKINLDVIRQRNIFCWRLVIKNSGGR